MSKENNVRSDSDVVRMQNFLFDLSKVKEAGIPVDQNIKIGVLLTQIANYEFKPQDFIV